MIGKLNFIEISKDISDDELNDLLVKHPDAVMFVDEEMITRWNKLKSKDK
ncbi:TPA: hypothetical protein KR288_002506 [Clostridioides difficile]|nr:hypothetical protein [Clostridioides difficile]WMU95185.1 hypothetical protein ADOKEBJH_00089 [Clostridioides phage AR1086-1]EIS9354889.1 hypothetical protein [Clostridioides difficile]EJA6689266.1 hypothetical protein [Clostridioides difficile]EJA6942050.1 hypothetical protein [Clostridioides difficile]EKS6785867.1 hypothetical protein [Clostridioides difficile]